MSPARIETVHYRIGPHEIKGTRVAFNPRTKANQLLIERLRMELASGVASAVNSILDQIRQGREEIENACTVFPTLGTLAGRRIASFGDLYGASWQKEPLRFLTIRDLLLFSLLTSEGLRKLKKTLEANERDGYRYIGWELSSYNEDHLVVIFSNADCDVIEYDDMDNIKKAYCPLKRDLCAKLSALTARFEMVDTFLEERVGAEGRFSAHEIVPLLGVSMEQVLLAGKAVALEREASHIQGLAQGQTGLKLFFLNQNRWLAEPEVLSIMSLLERVLFLRGEAQVPFYKQVLPSVVMIGVDWDSLGFYNSEGQRIKTIKLTRSPFSVGKDLPFIHNFERLVKIIEEKIKGLKADSSCQTVHDVLQVQMLDSFGKTVTVNFKGNDIGSIMRVESLEEREDQRDQDFLCLGLRFDPDFLFVIGKILESIPPPLRAAMPSRWRIECAVEEQAANEIGKSRSMLRLVPGAGVSTNITQWYPGGDITILVSTILSLYRKENRAAVFEKVQDALLDRCFDRCEPQELADYLLLFPALLAEGTRAAMLINYLAKNYSVLKRHIALFVKALEELLGPALKQKFKVEMKDFLEGRIPADDPRYALFQRMLERRPEKEIGIKQAISVFLEKYLMAGRAIGSTEHQSIKPYAPGQLAHPLDYLFTTAIEAEYAAAGFKPSVAEYVARALCQLPAVALEAMPHYSENLFWLMRRRLSLEEQKALLLDRPEEMSQLLRFIADVQALAFLRQMVPALSDAQLQSLTLRRLMPGGVFPVVMAEHPQRFSFLPADDPYCKLRRELPQDINLRTFEVRGLRGMSTGEMVEKVVEGWTGAIQMERVYASGLSFEIWVEIICRNPAEVCNPPLAAGGRGQSLEEIIFGALLLARDPALFADRFSALRFALLDASSADADRVLAEHLFDQMTTADKLNYAGGLSRGQLKRVIELHWRKGEDRGLLVDKDIVTEVAGLLAGQDITKKRRKVERLMAEQANTRAEEAAELLANILETAHQVEAELIRLHGEHKDRTLRQQLQRGERTIARLGILLDPGIEEAGVMQHIDVEFDRLSPNQAFNTAAKILGVGLNDPLNQVSQLYRKLALLFHPDRNPGNQTAAKALSLITRAWKAYVSYRAGARSEV